jgi:phage terminase small subunit
MNQLTKKQQTFVNEYIETGNGTLAAKKAYDIRPEDDNTAASVASENLRKPKIQDALEKALPDEMLNRIHLEGLHATKEIYKNNNETGQIEHVGTEPDYITRARYLDMAYKRKGSYAAEKKANLNVNVDVKEPSPRIIELADKLNK